MSTLQEFESGVRTAQLAVENGQNTFNALAEQRFKLTAQGVPSSDPRVQSLTRDIEAQVRQNEFNQESLTRTRQDLRNFKIANGLDTENFTAKANQDTAAGQVANADPQITQPQTENPETVESVSTDEASRIASADVSDPGEALTDPRQPQEPEPEPTNAGQSGQQITQSDGGSTAAAGADQVDADATSAYQLLRNPMHDFASYTYGLSLHLLTPQDYNDTVENENYIPKNVLIASAGRYDNFKGTNPFPRSPRFNVDFYFDDLNISTYVAPNTHNRNTNSISLRFKIIEPYGLSLIERLVITAKEAGIKNYIDAPYMLQIDFFGYDDKGIPASLREFTKYIPIKMIKMEVGFTEAGAEYLVNAVPFNHSAYDQSYVKTPSLFEIKAQTVAGFFQTDENVSSATTSTTERQINLEQENLGVANRGANRNTNGAISGDRPAFTGAITADSYGFAINFWCKNLVKLQKIEVADVYRFEFDKEIADAGITFASRVNHLDTGMADIEDVESIRKTVLGNLGKAVGTFNDTKQVYAINAGTSIERVIDYIVRSSAYILKQFTIPEEHKTYKSFKEALAAHGGALDWYKITPRVKLLEFDNRRGIYAREITYIVSKYKITNIPLDIAPTGKEKTPLKIYDYYYTGKNSDILDLKIQFNMLYYYAATVYRDALTETNPLPERELQQQEANPSNYQGVGETTNLNISELTPKVKKYQVLEARARATGSAVYAKQVAATELETWVLDRAPGDMIQADLKIIGDPHWIKQDDIFYGVQLSQDAPDTSVTDQRLTKNGSIKLDKGYAHVLINFRVPTDIDERTGLMDFNSTFNRKSIFSGLYLVTTIENNFNQGQFTQTLKLVRAYEQEEDVLVKKGVINSERQADVSDDIAGQTPEPRAFEAETAPSQAPTPGEVDDSSAPGPTGATEEEAPEREAEDLKQVAETAPTETITQQTEPVPSVPPSTNINDPNNLINSIQDNTLTKLTSSDPKVKLSAVEDSADKYRQLQTIYENQGDYARAKIAGREFEAQLQEREKLRKQLGI